MTDNRPFGPLCHWEYSDRCLVELDELYIRDPLGFGRIVDMIERSESSEGMKPLKDHENCRIPLAFAPRKVQKPPWLGELKVLGDLVGKRAMKGSWHHRLYFGKPTNNTDIVVAVGAWSKHNLTRAASTKQRDHIAKVMTHLKWWFGEHGYSWQDL